MLNGLYPAIIIITFFVLFFGIKFKKGSISLLRYFYWILFGVYISALAVYTFFPFPYQKYLIQVMIDDKLGLRHNLIPFKSMKEAIENGYLLPDIKQYIYNIFLFVPLGIALPVLFLRINKKRVILIGFLTSLAIEIIQAAAGFFIGYNYRSFDVDDLIMNTIGTVLGLLLFKFLFKYLPTNNLLTEK